MKCPKCKTGKVLQQVNVIVETDADCRSLCKKAIRSKKVKILGVGWPHASWFCSNGCGYYLKLDSKVKPQ
jgi:hypothetical protein